MRGFESSCSPAVFLEVIQGHVLGEGRGGGAWAWGLRGFAPSPSPSWCPSVPPGVKLVKMAGSGLEMLTQLVRGGPQALILSLFKSRGKTVPTVATRSFQFRSAPRWRWAGGLSPRPSQQAIGLQASVLPGGTGEQAPETR